jgi:ATP-dependent helicase HrpB
MTLPVVDALPGLLAALRATPSAVLIAPPGAGKTTAVAPALLDEDWCTGQILLLSPRRLAARAAAERMAEQAGEAVGRTIGYATRMDSRHSAATRILVITEGIFRTRIQADPELSGVSAVLFDEVHERSLDSDFGLALALDAQAALRPDLRIMAMSATLDGGRFATLMNAPVIESAGQSWPLTLRHLGRNADIRVEDAMAASIRRALGEAEGDILAFLPGVAEIERAAERIEGVAAAIHRLHGSLEPAEQRAAIRKGAGRKIILATAIAETSLTIDGVRIVIDSGLARRARYDRVAGVARLVTERASQAAVTQRAGRAARQGPGIAYRLWEEAATAGLPPYDPPEILEADLSPLLLDCALWGVTDPATLRWLDPPPPAALAEARARLIALGALNQDGRPTPHGRAIAALPLAPRLAHMLMRAHEAGLGALAVELAVLLSEHGLGGTDIDLERRLERWRADRGKRADTARGLARRWLSLLGGSSHPSPAPAASGRGAAFCLSLAFPDRVARRRDASGEDWISAGGRGFRLDSAHPLARAEWLAVADIQGAASGARILSAVAVAAEAVERLFADRIETGVHIGFDPATGSVKTVSGRRLGAIMLSRAENASASPAKIEAALLAGVQEHGLAMLNWPDTAIQMRTRARWAGIDRLSDDALLATLDQWLPPLLSGKRRLADIAADRLLEALRSQLGWEDLQRLDRLAPSHFTSPAGTTHPIDYAAEAGPTVELRVQALFGLAQHPCIGPDRMPLVLSLTSPAGRPIQTTRDLAGFWAGSWADVAKDMRGRYPRHNWPDNPAAARPSLKTKKALDRSR